MRNTKLLASALTLLPAIVSAQQAVITFDYLDRAVPLGPWVPMLCAVALALVAFFLHMRKGMVMRNLAIAGCATLIAVFAMLHQDVNAGVSTFPITLTASPSQAAITSNVGVATNATGRLIKIADVSIVQAQSSSSSASCSLAIVAATTTCNTGVTLPANSTCQIEVSCPF